MSYDLMFEDVKKSDWFYEDVQVCCEKGIMNGMDELHFAPYDYLVRAQFAVILHRIAGKPEERGVNRFSDVPKDSWFEDAVLWASKPTIGIIMGYGDGSFGAKDYLTRQHMVVIAYRYARYFKCPSKKFADISKYTDTKEIKEFSTKAFQWAVGNGLMCEKEKGTKLDPDGFVTRAEFAAFIRRFCDTCWVNDKE